MKPSPVVVTTICSLCDEPWEDHGDKPTAEDCVRLLKAKLAAVPAPVQIINPVIPYYPRPYPQWTYTCGSGTLTRANTSIDGVVTNTATINYRTPELVETTSKVAV